MDTVYTSRPDLSSPDERSAAYYAIIPANVRYNQQLSANAKLLYGEISALASREGYCFASNQYFADLYQVTPRSVIRMVKQLEDGGFIRTQEERDKETGQCKGRRIYLAVSTADAQPGDKIVTPSGQNCQEGGDKNVTPLLLINNNKIFLYMTGTTIIRMNHSFFHAICHLSLRVSLRGMTCTKR